MATTVKESFQQYKANLEITDRQESLVSRRCTNMVDVLKKELSLLPGRESKVIGSWDRSTLTRYLSEGDVDVLIILHYADNKGWDNQAGVTSCLDKFKQIIDSNYTNTVNRRDQNCITVKFAEFRLDVVPSFSYANGSYYKIPDTIEKKWIQTNPITFAENITRVNKKMNSIFVPLIKMAKGWNRQEGWPIKSFHLECILYKHYKGYTEDYTYSSTLKLFFEFLPTYLNAPCYDSVTGERVDGYLNDDTRQKAVRKAMSAAKSSAAAYSYEETNPEASIRIWKDFLGDFFPAYG